MALGALHLAAYERQAALQALGSRAVDPRDLWSKAEERHFHAALGKHKKDLRAVHGAVKTKDMASVVRLYYLKNGLKKREEREKARDAQLQKEARSREAAAARERQRPANAALPSNVWVESQPSPLDVAPTAQEEGGEARLRADACPQLLSPAAPPSPSPGVVSSGEEEQG
mmetsp:Transcript_17065/g.53988  ORF Transcript_17065/g.53988 Transcript_17065/m.53988 type:complete len:171 (+) Transcript_17065:337-849(+)